MVDDVKLRKRGNIYWFRKRVPLDLVDAFGQKFVQKSLRTSDLKAARLLAAQELLEFEQACSRARTSSEPTHSKRQPPVTQPIASEQEVLRELRDYVHSADMVNLGAFEEMDEEQQREAYLEAKEMGGYYADPQCEPCMIAVQSLELNRFPAFAQLDFFSSARKLARQHVREALLEIEARQVARLEKAPHPHTFNALFVRAPMSALPRSGPQTSTEGLTTTEFFAAWLDEYQKTTKATTSKRKDKMASALDLFTEYFGPETQISSIGRSQVRDFRDLLAVYPANARKKLAGRWRGPVNAVEAAQTYGWMPLSHTSQEEYCRQLVRAFTWARIEGFTATNPAEGLKPLPSKLDLTLNEERNPFTISELNSIFSSGTFSSVPREVSAFQQSHLSKLDYPRFLVPLIALFSGMRANEICQLDTADVVLDPSGTHYFAIRRQNSEGGLSHKRRKTASAERNVPVHSQLIKAGFLHYLEVVKASGEGRLFPGLRLSNDGYYSRQVTDWFNNSHLENSGVNRDRVSFHSLRHNFRDCLRDDVPLEIAWALGGWSAKGEDARYGQGATALPVPALSKHLERVQYVGLELGHLDVSVV